MLVLFTETTVAHPSSFEERAIHACTVHKYKRGSSFFFSRGGYAYLYCSQKQTWLTSPPLTIGLYMLDLFTNTNVAHPSSFPEGAMHACTVHKKTNVAHESD